MATRNLTTHFVRSRATAQRKRENAGEFHQGKRSGMGGPGGGFMPGEDDHSGFQRLDGSGAPAPAQANGAAAGGWDTRPLVEGGFNTAGMAPVYVDRVDAVQSEISQIQQKMKELEKLHKKRLMVQFDDSDQRQDQEIDIMTREITNHFNTAGSKLKQIAGENNNDPNSTDVQVRRNIQKSLASKLHELSKQFRQTQKKYLSDVKRQQEGASLDVLTGSGSAGQSSSKEVDMGFTDEQVEELAHAENVTEQRDREIQQIARGIEEIATIFKDLSTLVVDQGTILDRIDYNMEQVVESTRQGMEQLDKAESSQKSARPMKCILFLMFLIIILTIWLVVKKT
eukprot:gb/GECG01005143.1/.p1 GENE.gb/GECG01005143.1/~~gb/GECG01005143.1/.p1  ORF type:complete len:340 (+),score=59.28 gb/GECG01005143.1/:1-1020(+)